MKLIWLLGPPGAGKTTFVRNQTTPSVELSQMLQPLTKPWHVNQGVLGANGFLIEAIRSIWKHQNDNLPEELIIVVGCVKEEDLFPLGDDEEGWIILPKYERWERQLSNRPEEYFQFSSVAQELVKQRKRGFDEFAKEMYEYLSTLITRRELEIIESDYNPSLIGKLVEQQ